MFCHCFTSLVTESLFVLSFEMLSDLQDILQSAFAFWGLDTIKDNIHSASCSIGRTPTENIVILCWFGSDYKFLTSQTVTLCGVLICEPIHNQFKKLEASTVRRRGSRCWRQRTVRPNDKQPLKRFHKGLAVQCLGQLTDADRHCSGMNVIHTKQAWKHSHHDWGVKPVWFLWLSSKCIDPLNRQPLQEFQALCTGWKGLETYESTGGVL